MEIYNCEQRSDEWHALRHGVLTASSVGDILSNTNYRSFAFKVLGELLTGIKEDFTITAPMQWGIDHEDEAREWYEKHTGNKVTQVGFCKPSRDSRIGCSPDGLVLAKDALAPGLLEIKCPTTKVHLSYVASGPKLEYKRQMQFQMYVCNKAWCDFLTFDPRIKKEHLKGKITRVIRDEAMMKDIQKGVDRVLNLIDKFCEENDCSDVLKHGG